MSEMKTYDLYLSRLFKIMVFGMLGLFTVIGIIILASGFIFSGANGLPWFFGFFFIAIVAWNFYYIFSFPYRITVSGTGEISFIGVLKSRQLTTSEIKSITPDPRQFFGFLIIKTENTKIKILNQFDGFHEFIQKLKESNPSIELRGC